MLTTHAVGIDLGTTYSCIAYLNEHGEPVTLANQEGELATPSVVLFEDHEVVVGTEALRNAILQPERVVQNSKRYIGDANHRWVVNGKPYTPVDIATFVLKKLISAAQEQIGPIDQAVITVPALFSDMQRHATIEAGHRAGLQRVDIINEPVAAALCYVLGTEGLWFTELADEQRIMVYDLGGGTFDLSMVKYQKNEVSVIASNGDLNLGGIDWNNTLQQAICNQFTREFKADPREDPESLQYLALEVEQAKRSLTVRPRAALTCQHGGHRKTYQVEQAQFQKLTQPLVDRTTDITKRMLKENRMGWAHVDVVLTTGGASRMPMIRSKLKELSGRTLNTALSPDQSIAHGATYYAGMLLTNSKFARSILSKEANARLSKVKQQSVNARALGILVRDEKTRTRVPHYLVPANTPLPTAATQNFGTVVAGQRRVHLQIVESGLDADKPPAKLGSCVIEDLPLDLPEGSEIAVTISYDEQARVHVSARDVKSGKEATTEIFRQENLVPQLATDQREATDVAVVPQQAASAASSNTKPSAPASARPAAPALKPRPVPPAGAGAAKPANPLENSDEPVPLCNSCGEPLDARGRCAACGTSQNSSQEKGRRPAAKRSRGTAKAGSAPRNRRPARSGPPAVTAPADDEEIIELGEGGAGKDQPRRRPASGKPGGTPRRRPSRSADQGEDDFWQLTE